MSGSVYCARCQRRHFGRYGAAGLLLLSEGHALLTLRSAYVDQGGTWSIPGGALAPGEGPAVAAVREAREELAGLPTLTLTGQRLTDDHGVWRYTTLVAELEALPRLTPRNRETEAARWTPVAAVERLDRLHPAFARSWPHLAALTKEHTNV
ncbi:NUDIX domain-containing protein [Ornithinimicrobium cryptoxanthini]|uniref:NUDIX domain-containing protein n=1 Tax=Ornithinimicrobium cryptoxanthini TaxID=2934161 RepID=UPI00211828C0|nr:NUDIX hydrolase [Ornithinimicrobium cryptoxanthini]